MIVIKANNQAVTNHLCISGSCSGSQFQCYPDSACIESSKVCDGTVDCLDNFVDESIECDSGTFN